jgi:hypothetical protein
MKLAIICHLEKGAIRALLHFLDSGEYLFELRLRARVVVRSIVEVCEDFESLLMLALHDQPEHVEVSDTCRNYYVALRTSEATPADSVQ